MDSEWLTWMRLELTCGGQEGNESGVSASVLPHDALHTLEVHLTHVNSMQLGFSVRVCQEPLSIRGEADGRPRLAFGFADVQLRQMEHSVQRMHVSVSDLWSMKADAACAKMGHAVPSAPGTGHLVLAGKSRGKPHGHILGVVIRALSPSDAAPKQLQARGCLAQGKVNQKGRALLD